MLKKTVELAPGAVSNISKMKDGVELLVRVPMRTFDESWEDLGRHLEPVLMPSLSEEDLRLRCAAFCAVYGSLPMLTSDLTAWALRTGCPGSVLDTVERYFGRDELRRSFAA